MKVTQSQAVKLLIDDVERLDPITVFLEDLAPSKGKITIECYGKSWSTFWPGMGGRTIAEFFCSNHIEYIANNLDPHLEKYEPDFETFGKEMRQKICEIRRDRYVSKALARELYDVEDWSEYVSSNPYEPIINPCSWGADEFQELGFDGFDIPERTTSEYRYLCLIIGTVQMALNEIGLSKAKAA